MCPRLYLLPRHGILVKSWECTAGQRKCANPECHAEFKRLGTGKIYSLPVTQSQAWGLPADVKQKVVWLCSKCAASKDVEFDEQF